MGLRISDRAQFSGAAPAALGGASAATFSCRVRVEPGAVPVAVNAPLWGIDSGRCFALSGNTNWGFPSLKFSLLASNGSAYAFGFNYIPGRSYHIAATWDAANSRQVFYLDGVVAGTAASALSLQTILAGNATAALGASFSISDCRVWAGIALDAAAIRSIRDGSAVAPEMRHDLLISWRALAGPDGAPAATGDPGLADAVDGVALSASGAGVAAWSSDPLAFVAPMATAARVLKSGRTIAFFFSDPVTGKPSNAAAISSHPTISVNGGAPIALANPAFTTSGNSFPFALYPLPSRLAASDVVAYSAPEGWATSPTPVNTLWQPLFAGAAASAAVVNGAGLPNLEFPAPTMQLGLNLAAPDYWTVNRHSRNIVETAGLWQTPTARDPNGKPTAFSGGSLAFRLPDASSNNGIDSLLHVAPTSVPWLPNNPGLYTIVWDEAAPGNDSNFRLQTSSGNMSNNRAVIVERPELAINPPDGKGRTRVYEVTRPANPVDYTLGLYAACSRADWTRLGVFGPGNEADFDDPVDETLKAYAVGARVVRYMDLTVTNNSPVATRDHLRPATDFNHSFARPQWATITQANPVANVADYAFGKGWMAVSFTTAAPHPFRSGQFLTFKNCVNLTAGGARVLAEDGTSSGALAAGSPIFVTSPTTFDAMFWHGNTSLGTNTANASATPQLFDPASQAGLPSTTVGVCYEDVFRSAVSMGVEPWICVPFAADDDCVRAIAEKARDCMPAGTKIWVEFSNEVWNTGNGFTGQSVGAIIRGNKSSPKVGGTYWAAVRAGQVHDIFAGVLGAAGREGDLVRVMGWQWGNPAGAAGFVNFCASKALKIDAFAIAPYRGLPNALMPAIDGYDSDQLHDLWQLYLTYNYPSDSSQPGGTIPTHRAALAAAYPDAKLVCYEGSIQDALPNSATNRARRIHDLVYDPGMYDTLRAYYASAQASGVSLFCHFQLSHAGDWAYAAGGWSLYHWHGQRWGRGDGLDGKADNRQCSAISKPATVQQDLQNVSVAGQAWKDWAAVAGGAPRRRKVLIKP